MKPNVCVCLFVAASIVKTLAVTNVDIFKQTEKQEEDDILPVALDGDRIDVHRDSNDDYMTDTPARGTPNEDFDIANEHDDEDKPTIARRRKAMVHWRRSQDLSRLKPLRKHEATGKRHSKSVEEHEDDHASNRLSPFHHIHWRRRHGMRMHLSGPGRRRKRRNTQLTRGSIRDVEDDIFPAEWDDNMIGLHEDSDEEFDEGYQDEALKSGTATEASYSVEEHDYHDKPNIPWVRKFKFRRRSRTFDSRHIVGIGRRRDQRNEPLARGDIRYVKYVILPVEPDDNMFGLHGDSDDEFVEGYPDFDSAEEHDYNEEPSNQAIGRHVLTRRREQSVKQLTRSSESKHCISKSIIVKETAKKSKHTFCLTIAPLSKNAYHLKLKLNEHVLYNGQVKMLGSVKNSFCVAQCSAPTKAVCINVHLLGTSVCTNVVADILADSMIGVDFNCMKPNQLIEE